jgi:hypothetical protein
VANTRDATAHFLTFGNACDELVCRIAALLDQTGVERAQGASEASPTCRSSRAAKEKTVFRRARSTTKRPASLMTR